MRAFFPMEKVALSYSVGLGLLTIEMAVLSLLGIKFSIYSLSACIMLLVAVAALIMPKQHDTVRGIKRERLSGLEKFFISAISLEMAYVFFRTLIMPMEAYDAIAIYALKSKIFYLAGAIPHNFFSAFKDIVPHIEYPLLVPLAETSFYVYSGSLNDLAVKTIFPLYYVSLLAVFYSVLKRFLNRKQSLLFTFFLATIPQVTDFATNGYADFPFAFYCSSAMFYLYLWIREKRNSFIVLSFVLSMLAMWTKAEGIMFAIINITVAVIYAMKDRAYSAKGYAYAALSMLTVAVYVLMWHALGLTVNSDFASSNVPMVTKLASGFERLPAILYEYQIQFFGPKKWNIVWVLFIIGFVIGVKKILSKELMPLTVDIFMIFSGYSAVYMLSSASQGIGWHLSTSGSRLFLHFVPVVLLWLAVMFKELKLEI